MLNNLKSTDREKLNMKRTAKDKIKKETSNINKVLSFIDTTSMGETHDLIYAVACIVQERLTEKEKHLPKGEQQEPPWKRRLLEKLQVLRSNLACLNNIKEERQQMTQEPEHKYHIQRKGRDCSRRTKAE